MPGDTRRRRRIGALILAAGIVLAAAGWLYDQYRTFLSTPLDIPVTGATLTIAPGSSLTTVTNDLAGRGVVHNPRMLVWYGRLSGMASRLQAGEYELTPGLTPVQLLDRLARGEVVQHRLTLVEGWTFDEVLAAVRQHPALDHRLGEAGPEEIMARLGHPDQHPEGRFLPETYHFPRGMTDLEFLRRAYDAMEEVLATEWAGRAPGLPFEAPYEALILASIVEKETALPEERPRIAGVFVRRLQKGMRLQTDPTVIYGLGASFDGNLRRRDLRRDTPYNTYTRHGLPPTPIAMPSAAAIHAVLHPADGDELYFVARGDGSHAFSATLAQHNRAVSRYQLKRNKGRQQAGED